jgi:hypothetical protein
MSEYQQENETEKPDVGEAQVTSSDDNRIGNYKVGYKRPPVHSRFRTGQSGNPKGRPAGGGNAKTTVQRVMNEKVSVRRGQKTSTVSTLEAMVQAHAVKAMKGDARSAAMVINVMSRTGLLADQEDESISRMPSAGCLRKNRAQAMRCLRTSIRFCFLGTR